MTYLDVFYICRYVDIDIGKRYRYRYRKKIGDVSLGIKILVSSAFATVLSKFIAEALV